MTAFNRIKSCFPVIALALLFTLVGAEAAHATVMQQVLCDVYDLVVGPIGMFVASAGIVLLGGSAVLGRVSAGLALTVGVGIFIIFNAGTVAGFFGIAAGC